MSHCPGDTLEDFLTDLYGIIVEDSDVGSGIRRLYANQLILNNEQFQRIVAVYEPIRGDIERLVERYSEEDCGSWRDYKYFVIADWITESIEAQAKEILIELEKDCKKSKGLFG